MNRHRTTKKNALSHFALLKTSAEMGRLPESSASKQVEASTRRLEAAVRLMGRITRELDMEPMLTEHLARNMWSLELEKVAEDYVMFYYHKDKVIRDEQVG